MEFNVIEKLIYELHLLVFIHNICESILNCTIVIMSVWINVWEYLNDWSPFTLYKFEFAFSLGLIHDVLFYTRIE